MVQRPGDRERTLARHRAKAGFEAHHATVSRRADDRAVGLCAQSQRHHAGGHGRRRAAGGAARRVFRVEGVDRGPVFAPSEFCGDCFATHHRTLLPQGRHDGGILRGPVGGVNRRAVGGDTLRGIDQVLHRHRNPGPRTGAGRGQQIGGRQARDKGVQCGIQAVCPGCAFLQVALCRDRARGDSAAGIEQAQWHGRLGGDTGRRMGGLACHAGAP